jgi:hypothetical protein
MSRLFYILFITIFLLSTPLGYSQKDSSPNFLNDKFCQAGLIWGFLKYHHPTISEGRFNWDKAGIDLMRQVEKIENQQELDVCLLNFITDYPYKKTKSNIGNTKYFDKNEDYSWIDNGIFKLEIKNKLLEIKDNTQPKDHYAKINTLSRQLDFKNEKGFKAFDFAEKSHRLLFLFNFWNAIQYWNVNKYLMDEPWLTLLSGFVADFNGCRSKLDFELAKSKLIARLNDSHSYYLSTEVTNTSMKFMPPFTVKNINDSLIVHYIYNKELATKDTIEIGDVITKIKNNDIKTEINNKLKDLISASNLNYLARWSHYLMRSDADILAVTILKKDGRIVNKNIGLYESIPEGVPESISFYEFDKVKTVKPDIGYINLERISINELKDAFTQFKNTKGLILDLRNYPKSVSGDDIAKFLYPKRKEFIKILFPLKVKPSLGEFDGDAPIAFIKDPFLTGSSNPDYYKGKVILLVDSKTQSNAEYIGMAIQNSPNCITIGQQTAGAVMNVVEYTMSDDTKIYFTGLGAFYPDGSEAQRNGLKIDFYLKYNAKKVDINLYIKKAINLIEN